MGFDSPSFVAPTFAATSFLGARLATVTSTKAQHHVPQKRRYSRIVCAAADSKKVKKGDKRKSAPPPVFATDIKGNFVWTLRAATAEDVSAVSELVDDKFPSSMVAGFIEDSGCCVLCEASVKGTKEGQGYSGQVMGAALVDVSVEVRDKGQGFESGFVKKAELLAVVANSELPNVDDVKKKLLLGAMKKLKGQGAVEIGASAGSSDEKKISLLKACQYVATGTTGSRVEMKCNLIAENPDPQKKLL